MTDAFSEYVALLDDVEQIPVAARELPTLSDNPGSTSPRNSV